MYIVRWLMGHPIIAIWVLLGAAILLGFGSGDDINGSTVTTQLEKVEIIGKPPVSSEEGVPKVNTDNSPAEVKDDIHKIASLDSMEPSVTPLEKKLDTIENKVGQKSSSESDEAREGAITDLSQLDGEEMLLMAREAYWNNGLDEAAQIYTKLIKIEPNIIEHKGELGNVFWRQGYPKKAAELYSEIAIPMIENGNSERVANMIGFIGLFYPDRAALIHQRMQSNLGIKEKRKEVDNLLK